MVKTESATLAHREMVDTRMPAEHLPFAVDDLSLAGQRTRADLFDRARVIAVGHEADLLALGLVGSRQSEFARPGANFLFFEFAERELDRFQLFLTEFEQKIGLVLLPVDRTSQAQALGPRVDIHPRIVARRHPIRAEDPRALEQIVELEPRVAGHAGNRCPAREIIVRERANYFGAKTLRVIRNVESDAEVIGDAPRIVNVGKRTAPRRPTCEVERHANDFATRFDEQGRRHRRVDATRKRGDYALALSTSALDLANRLPICAHAPTARRARSTRSGRWLSA